MTTSPSQTENNGIAARYYAPPAFTSRDPLFEQKPWLTPYHYCSNNPVGRVDPTGMLDGDYYDWDGNYLGWDGVEDDKIHFVSDSKSINNINTNEAKGCYTSTNDVSIDVSTTRHFIFNVLDVDNRTNANGNYREEATYFPVGDGFGIPIMMTGPDVRTLPEGINPTVSIPRLASGGSFEASIHSHLAYTIITGGKSIGWEARVPSDGDKKFRANLNVITGPSGHNQWTGKSAPNEAAFYDNKWNLKGSISIQNLRKLYFNTGHRQ